MRTKTLLATAALIAVGAASSMAQSNVYSLNVVGYVNTVVEGGGAYNLICNPLNNTSGGNYNTNLFKGLPDGANIFLWDSSTYDFSGTVPVYSEFFAAWDIDVDLPVGQGFFLVNPGDTFTNTFVGEVVQGSVSRPIVGSGAYNAVGSTAPIGGSFTNVIAGLVPADGDNVFKWDTATYDFSGTVPVYSEFFGTWDITALNINVGEAIFYVRSGEDTTWVRNFTVQ
jgi:hypothetical protein